MAKLYSLLFACTLLLGAEPQKLWQMVHRTWTAEGGAPQGIQAMTQTPDGLIWMSSLSGLYVFDGITFTLWNPTEESRSFFLRNFHYLLASKNGDLWLFGFHGAPGRLRKGQFKLFDRIEWPTVEELKFPQEDSKGKLWAVLNERQLVGLTADGVWRPSRCPKNGSGHITELYIDSSDTAWLVVDETLYRRPIGQQDFEQTSINLYGDPVIQEGMHKELWISSSGSKGDKHPDSHLHHLDGNGRELTAPDLRDRFINAVYAADGTLWLQTKDNTLLRLTKDELSATPRTDGPVEPDQMHLSVRADMSGSRTFFQGLEGGIWIAGLGGLERFSSATLVPSVPDGPVGNWRSCIDSSGSVWINDPNEALYRLGEGGYPRSVDKEVSGLFCSADGTILLRDEHKLAVLRDGHAVPLPPIPQLERYSNQYMITGGTKTNDGRLLAAASGRVIGYSLWSFSKGVWHEYLAGQKMPEVSAMYSDHTGRVLLGFRGSDSISVVEGSRIRRLDSGTPGIRSTMGFTETRYGLIAYGTNGIAIDEGTNFRMLPFASPEHASSVMGLVESRNGDIWIASAAGVVRIFAGEIQHALVDTRYRLASNDIRDGSVAGPSIPELFSSKAHIDKTGRLWFTTLNGVMAVDAQAVRPSAPPRLSIRDIRADSREVSEERTFPPNIRVLAIDYIGVDFPDPRGVRYEYKLDGYDKAWQYAGARTEAIYTYPRPGKYRFEVMAQNAYGAWTAPVISAPFTVLPRWYQWAGFQVVCALVLLVFIWLIVRARLKFVEASIRERAEERADERISIARDLHDTLLQGVQGLLLSFHTAAERVPESHESKAVLEKALATADKIILEGRDRVKGLRQQDITGKELCSSLKALGDDLNSAGKLQYSVVCVEGRKMLTSHVASEAFLIAREAIVNAFRHAQATKISVWVDYGRREFTLHCDDNGTGFDTEQYYKSMGHGHWGVRGMSERAERVRGVLEMRSQRGRGTSVRLSIKARRAYE